MNTSLFTLLEKFLRACLKHLNAIALFAGVWAFFVPIPYRLVIVLNAGIFAAAIGVFIHSRGAIGFIEPRKPGIMHVTTALCCPAAVLAWRAFSDFHQVQAHDLLVPVSAAFALIAVPLILAGRSFRIKARKYLTALPMVFAFSFASVVELNVLACRAPATEYLARVISKQVSRDSGDGPNLYYLMVTGWLNRRGENKLVVSRKVYNSFSVNDIVPIKVRRGALNIPYYYVPAGLSEAKGEKEWVLEYPENAGSP